MIHLTTSITQGEQHLMVAIHVNQETDLMKPWSVGMNPPIVIGTGVITPCWMP